MKYLLAFALSLTLLISCTDKFAGAFEARFEIPLQVLPAKETFRMGQDTVWVVFALPDTVYDRETKKYYRFNNFDFKTRIGFFKLKPNLYLAEQEGALPYFTVIGTEGVLENKRLTYCYLTLIYRNNHYYGRVGIIPKQAGVYTLLFDSRYSHLAGGPKPDVAPIDTGGKYMALQELYYIVNQGKTNFPLFKANANQSYDHAPSESNQVTEQLSTFTFRVE